MVNHIPMWWQPVLNHDFFVVGTPHQRDHDHDHRGAASEPSARNQDLGRGTW